MNKSNKALLDSIIFGKLSKLDNDTKKAIFESIVETKDAAKWSVNGAKIGEGEAKLDEKDADIIVFSGNGLKSRKFSVKEVQVAAQKVELQQFDGENKFTGTRFVRVDGKVYGENLVLLAKTAGII
jgi:hypothetical protein